MARSKQRDLSGKGHVAKALDHRRSVIGMHMYKIR